MADSELADLTEDTTPDATDWIYGVDSGGTTDKKYSVANLAAAGSFSALYVPKSSTAWAIKDYDEVTLTSGDITMNATAITGMSGLDMTLTATSGDRVLYGISGRLENVNTFACFDVYTMVGGSRVNPFGAGLSAGLASTAGVPGWVSPGTDVLTLTGDVPRTLVSGDISSGTVTLRLHNAKVDTTARKLYANANSPAKVWATVLTPVT